MFRTLDLPTKKTPKALHEFILTLEQRIEVLSNTKELTGFSRFIEAVYGVFNPYSDVVSDIYCLSLLTPVVDQYKRNLFAYGKLPAYIPEHKLETSFDLETLVIRYNVAVEKYNRLYRHRNLLFPIYAKVPENSVYGEFYSNSTYTKSFLIPKEIDYDRKTIDVLIYHMDNWLIAKSYEHIKATKATSTLGPLRKALIHNIFPEVFL